MSIVLGKVSLARLDGVHPDLVRVVKRAALIALPSQDFMVVQGVRTKAQMAENYGKGRTVAECAAKGVPAECAQPRLPKVTWLTNPYASNHGVKADGYGHAVDLAPYPYKQNETLEKLTAMANVMKSAAHQEGVEIVWGGDWSSSKDYAHFEVKA